LLLFFFLLFPSVSYSFFLSCHVYHRYLHSFPTRRSSDLKDFVINVSKYDDINDLMLITDILITDYSSVMFDFANTNKPMIFYTRSEEHTSELQSRFDLVCRLLLEKKKQKNYNVYIE